MAGGRVVHQRRITILVAMGAETAEDLLHAGREALAAADWARARACFERALVLGESAEVLDGLSGRLTSRVSTTLRST